MYLHFYHRFVIQLFSPWAASLFCSMYVIFKNFAYKFFAIKRIDDMRMRDMFSHYNSVDEFWNRRNITSRTKVNQWACNCGVRQMTDCPNVRPFTCRGRQIRSVLCFLRRVRGSFYSSDMRRRRGGWRDVRVSLIRTALNARWIYHCRPANRRYYRVVGTWWSVLTPTREGHDGDWTDNFGGRSAWHRPLRSLTTVGPTNCVSNFNCSVDDATHTSYRRRLDSGHRSLGCVLPTSPVFRSFERLGMNKRN